MISNIILPISIGMATVPPLQQSSCRRQFARNSLHVITSCHHNSFSRDTYMRYFIVQSHRQLPYFAQKCERSNSFECTSRSSFQESCCENALTDSFLPLHHVQLSRALSVHIYLNASLEAIEFALQHPALYSVPSSWYPSNQGESRRSPRSKRGYTPAEHAIMAIHLTRYLYRLQRHRYQY